MIEYNEEIFEQLKSLDRTTDEFKKVQRKALRLVHQYENALCNRSETTGYTQYATGLADKFMAEVRNDYPEIDYI